MASDHVARIDRDALPRAVDQLVDLVSSAEVAARWSEASALPGLTVGGLVRHLVSQPECAVEFLTGSQPDDAVLLGLLAHYERADWLDAPVEAVENTSIRDDFNAMAAGGPAHSIEILDQSRAGLRAAIAGAGPTTYVPWQDCALLVDDFLTVRLLEVVVHADDLAVSTGASLPAFDDDVLRPVWGLLGALSARRHGPAETLRALARTERARGSASAFG